MSSNSRIFRRLFGPAAAPVPIASKIPFDPTTENPSDNVQDAIEWAQNNANARWIDDVPVSMAGALAGGVLKVVGAPGFEQIIAEAACDVQLFESTDTWFKPAGAKAVQIILIGGGGGGDSGQVTAPGLVALGGNGGGGGAMCIATMPASLLESSVAVIVGLGGVGGARSATATPNLGTAGGDTQFGGLTAEGANTAVFGGFSYTGGQFPGAPRTVASSTGGASVPLDRLSVTAGGFATGMPSGSSGAGITAADATSLAPGFKQQALMVSVGNLSPGVNLDGLHATRLYNGQSGAGGGARDAADGESGGEAGKYGCGGGGGGAARTGFLSGAGGNGAPGVALIITFF